MLLVITEEFRDDQSMGTLGEVFICCNNILCIGSAIRGTVVYAYRHCRPRSASRSPQYRSLVQQQALHNHPCDRQPLDPQTYLGRRSLGA
ncbi:hypothetical protein EV401DRAFT_2217416, partial [Pisolithus croceorrhizus]